jgi:ABC-type nitrate/sulfonate/bicarbonate transport system substrate-binding protein
MRALVLLLAAGVLACAAPENTPTPPVNGAPAPAPVADPPQAATPRVKLKVAYGAVAGGMAAPWFAQEGGAFDRNGLEVELSLISGGSQLLAALFGGDVQLGAVGAGPVVQGRLEGSDLVLVASLSNTLVFSLYGVPSVESPQALRGREVGVSRFGSTTDLAARLALRHVGLEPERDVTIKQVGGVPETLAALEAGAIAAGILSPPTTLKAQDAGLREFVDIDALNVPYTGTGIAVSQAYLVANRDIVRRFLLGIVEGITRAKRDPEFAKQVIGRYTNTEDPRILAETYRLYVERGLNDVPYVSAAAVETAIEEVALANPKAQGTDPTSYFDNTVLEELERRGRP